MQTIRIAKDLQLCIEGWIIYLRDNLVYSDRTLNSYASDMFYFLQFMYSHREQPISIEILAQLSIQDFRSWLAYRKKKSKDQL